MGLIPLYLYKMVICTTIKHDFSYSAILSNATRFRPSTNFRHKCERYKTQVTYVETRCSLRDLVKFTIIIIIIIIIIVANSNILELISLIFLNDAYLHLKIIE